MRKNDLPQSSQREEQRGHGEEYGRRRKRRTAKIGCATENQWLRGFGFQGLALFLTAFFDHFAVGGEGLLGILRATGAAVRLAELEIGEIAVGLEFFRDFEVGDGAFDIALLEES